MGPVSGLDTLGSSTSNTLGGWKVHQRVCSIYTILSMWIVLRLKNSICQIGNGISGLLRRMRQCACPTIRDLRQAQWYPRNQDSTRWLCHQTLHGDVDIGRQIYRPGSST